ncbi:MAG TPA: glycosyltransferase family 2 protein, partial [Patescibacteria group bacterium]
MRNKYKKILVVIVHFNDYKNLNKCLASLSRLKKPKDSIVETVVIDNESNNVKLSKIMEMFPEVHFIAEKKNLGFSEGVNEGARYALANKMDYTLVSSPDLTMEPDVLSKLYTVLKNDKKLGAVGSKVLTRSKNPKIYFIGGVLDKIRKTSIHIGLNEVDKGQYREIDKFDFLNCPVLIKSEIFKKIGYLKKDFFLYYEDIDWYFRLKKEGYTLECVYDSVSWNENPQLNRDLYKRKAYYCSRNYLYFLISNFSIVPITLALIYELKDLLFIVKKILINPKKFSKSIDFYTLLGIKDFL